MEKCGRAGLNIHIRHSTVQWRKARIFNCFFSVPPRLPDMVCGRTIKLNISQMEAKTSSGIKPLEGGRNKSDESDQMGAQLIPVCLFTVSVKFGGILAILAQQSL